MKGISLPLNTIVILIIAMLILVVVGAFFTSHFWGSNVDMILSDKCTDFVMLYNCDETKYDTNLFSVQLPGDSAAKSHSLKDICDAAGANTKELCLKKCGCP